MEGIQQTFLILVLGLTMLLMATTLVGILYILYRLISDQKERKAVLEEHLPSLDEKITEIKNALSRVLEWQAFISGRGMLPALGKPELLESDDSSGTESDNNHWNTALLPPKDVMDDLLMDYNKIKSKDGIDKQAFRNFRDRWKVITIGLANGDECKYNPSVKGQFKIEPSGDLWGVRFHARDRSFWIMPEPGRSYSYQTHLSGRWRDVFDADPTYSNGDYKIARLEATGLMQFSQEGIADVVEKGKIILT